MVNKSNLLQKMALYSATAVAVTGASAAYALDTMNPLPVTINAGGTAQYPFDFNDNGDPEFSIFIDSSSGVFSIQALPDLSGGGGVDLLERFMTSTGYVTGYGTYYLVKTFNTGATISSTSGANSAFFFLNSASSNVIVGDWAGTQAFAGMVLNLDGDNHFAWVEFDMSEVSGAVTRAPDAAGDIDIVRAFYNPTPGASIVAGATAGNNPLAITMSEVSAGQDQAPNRFTVVWASAAAVLSAATLWVRRRVWGEQN